MANEEHLAILRRGVEAWNQWMAENPHVRPDLMGADLTAASLMGADLREAYLNGANLQQANLSKANLSGATLSEANLWRAGLHSALLVSANLIRANLSEANLNGAILVMAGLTGANLRKADLREAHLTLANLNGVDLSEADLSGASLSSATLVETQLEKAILTKCRIYGISVWNANLRGAKQSDLIISKGDEPEVTVDNLEIAQFVYMLLNNAKIRDVIDTLTTKAVLILGRFTDERKVVLDAIKNELRRRNYVPILFDFEKPASRDLTETIVTLAHLSRFVIADITDAKSIPQELQAIVPNLLSVPIQPIILAAQREYAMFEHFRRYPSVLPLHEYESQDQLIAELPEKVIEPAERKVEELRG
ncbi:MAG: pentapeptide repeat-containing protein [Anaerolineae bacterium]|nr:pentapeptide repeat-containing protein [Anaerolineae bacterium]